jgi:hypothetical protein
MAFGKKKTEDEATFPTRKELDNPPPPPKQDVLVDPLDKAMKRAADEWCGPSAETQATAALNNARQLLEHVGHFETNQAIVSIDAALEWLKKCEGQRT